MEEDLSIQKEQSGSSVGNQNMIRNDQVPINPNEEPQDHINQGGDMDTQGNQGDEKNDQGNQGENKNTQGNQGDNNHGISNQEENKDVKKVEPNFKAPPVVKRKKVPLKPGYTLGAWVGLIRSGKNLGGAPRKVFVTPEQLSQHNKRDDIWISLRGNVYNITAYMDYHPGGDKILMAVAGKDASKLFSKYHDWVNEEFLLSACLIGKLVIEEEPTIS